MDKVDYLCRGSSKELITVCVGGCGNNVGSQVWRQFWSEHDEKKDGGESSTKEGKRESYRSMNRIHTCFEEVSECEFKARGIFVDTDPNTEDWLKWDHRIDGLDSLFSDYKDCLICGSEDTSNNYARGFYNIGKEILPLVSDALRKLADDCDDLMGFQIFNSVGGGTGSGLGSLILDVMSQEYRKKTKLGIHVYPHSHRVSPIVQPYNSLMSTHWLLDHTELSVVFDPKAMLEQFSFNMPKLTNFQQYSSHLYSNHLISRMVSSITSDMRFEGELMEELSDLQIRLVPFPRLHFVIPSMAPFSFQSHSTTDVLSSMDEQSLMQSCLDYRNYLVHIPEWDPKEEMFLSLKLKYHGSSFSSRKTNAAVQWWRKNETFRWHEWGPMGWYQTICDRPFRPCLCDPKLKESSLLSMNESDKSVTSLVNNCGMHHFFERRINDKYDRMFRHRCFVHWFIAEGMEEGEFQEAREDIGFLVKDYLDCMTEYDTESEEESD